MNSSVLSSVLSQHGVIANTSQDVNNNNNNNNNNTQKTSNIRALEVHPSLPQIAYLEEELISTTNIPSPTSSSRRSSRGSPTSAAAANNNTRTQTSAIKSQRLVIQQYNRHSSSVSNYNNNNTGGNILASISLNKLPSYINQYRQHKSKSYKITNSNFTLSSIGKLQSITFLDRNALFWHTRRQYGSLSNLKESSSGGGMEGGEQIVLHADSDLNNVNGIMGQGLCLGLQFDNVLVVLQFNNTTNIINSTAEQDEVTILCCLEGQRTSSGKDLKVQYTPTSAFVPITNSIVVYGCSDGAMRFYNLVPSMLYSSKVDQHQGAGVVSSSSPSSPTSTTSSIGSNKQTRQSTVKSVRGPNGRNDPVVQIINVDPLYNISTSSKQPSLIPTPQGSNDAETKSDDQDDATLVLHSRLLTVCASGVAFLWDVHVMIDRATGALRDLNVLPPLVRLDGLGRLTMSPRASSALSFPQARTSSGFWGVAELTKSNEGASEAPYSKVTPIISYDPNRNLLTWSLPSNAPLSSIDHRGEYDLNSVAPKSLQAKKDEEDQAFMSKWVAAGNGGGFVKVWDLSLVDELIASVAKPSSSPRPPPKMPPVAIISLPKTVASASSHHSVLIGLTLSPITTASISCVGISTDGSKVLIYSAPLPAATDNIDTLQEGGSQSSTSTSSPAKKSKQKKVNIAKPKLLYVNSTKCHEIPLAGLSLFARASAVCASSLVSDTLVVTTDQGVAIANADGETWSTKIEPLMNKGSTDLFTSDAYHPDQHPKIASGSVHSIISIGGVGNRPGIIYVENHAVYTSRLISSSSHDTKQALMKKVDLHDPMLLCQLHERKVPWRTTRVTRMSTVVESTQYMKCPPRLMSSPSGRYLCLYWESEKRYEILHANSLLSREHTVGPASSTLEGGAGQLLQQHVTPSVDFGSNVLSFAWVGDEDNFALLRVAEVVFPQDISEGQDAFNDDFEVDSMPPSKTKGKPKVELYKLAEVEVDAVELAAGASIAAATTVSLGSLSIRGGDRIIPNSLFGGPSLCVGCLSKSDRSDISDDVTYFYSRKSSAIEKNDERASAYTTVGTSIPHPDLLTWEESGQLCAVSYGSRVTIYLSKESKFILLGSVRVQVGGANNTQGLVSMKFIHGALYCSTQSSVHVIFLGDIEQEDTICELDSFVIATDAVPLYGIDNPDISSSSPIITSLAQPHILSYHSGGLLVSTNCGLRLLPLSHPMIRIGTLLAANLIDRARKWIVTTPQSDHDALAQFLIRRGHVDLVLHDLNGLSLETYIDLCMLYDRVDELEHLLDSHLELVSEISDWDKQEDDHSAFYSICMYLLGHDKIDCAKKLISQAAASNIPNLSVDAMRLATYISAVDEQEGNTLLNKINIGETNNQVALVK